MDTGFMVLALLMAFTGFFLLLGGFGGMLYLLWQRGKERSGGGGSPGAGNEAEGVGQ